MSHPVVQSDSEELQVGARPTNLRHWVVLVASLMSVLLYLDRFCISFAEVYIQEGLKLTKADMAWFISAFFWSYALAQVPAGWFSDRYGARVMMVLYILSWSVFTALIGLAQGLWFLLAMRLGCGLGQAGAYPTSASLLSKWVPFSNRGTASSFVANGGRLGLVLAPVLTAYLMVAFVPAEKGSLLQPTELFADQEGALAAKIAPTDPPPGASQPATKKQPGDRVWELASADVRPLIAQLAAEQRTLQGRQDAVRKEAESLTKQEAWEAVKAKRLELEQLRPVPLTAENRARLLDALNGILQRDDFYEPRTFDALNIPREGLDYLVRLNAGEPLLSLQTQRLNRLLLETSFPAQIGKIYVSGWRPVMLIYGLAGLLVAAAFWIVFRNRPSDHPWCNAAERQLIESGRPAGAPSPHGKAGAVPWMRLISSFSLWMDSLAQVGTNIGWFFLVSFLGRYLYEVYQVEIITRAWMLTIPAVGGVLGMLVGGPLTDRATAALGLRWGRSLPIAITRFGAAGAYLASLWANDPWVATFLYAAVWFFCDLGIASMWAFKQDVGGRYVGSILGWGNMWGNLAAAIAAPLYVAVLTKTPTVQDWNNMFLMCAGAFVVSGFASLGINATIPIAPPDEEELAAEPT